MKTLLRIASLILTVGIVLLNGCDTSTTGTISGTCYDTAMANPANQVAGIARQPSLLVVSPPIGGKTLFTTDALGNFSIPDVPAGTYSIAPVFFPERAESVVVTANGNVTSDLRYSMPEGIQCLYFNVTDTTVPLSNKEVRQAFGSGLDHGGIASSVTADIGAVRTALSNFIPIMSLQTTPLQGMNVFTYSVATSANLLSGKTLAGFTVLVGTAGGEQDAFGTRVAASLSAVSGQTVTFTPAADKATRLQSKSYVAGRGGWTMNGADSTNDVVRFLDQLFRSTSTSNYAGISNATLDGLLDQAKAARDAGDGSGYVARVIDINNLLVTEVPVIPLYYTAP